MDEAAPLCGIPRDPVAAAALGSAALSSSSRLLALRRAGRRRFSLTRWAKAGGAGRRCILVLVALLLVAVTSAQTFDVIAPSEARYRVRERVLGIWMPATVGAAQAVTGSVTFDVAVVGGGSGFSVEAARITSDQPVRDAAVRRETLATDEHPLVVFRPVRVTGLPSPLPRDGLAEITILGDLTIREAAHRVTWTGTAKFDGELVELEASTSVTFEELDLPKPGVGALVMLDDTIVLEVSLLLRRR
jgi:polyisoprenoid-binding protein YceI